MTNLQLSVWFQFFIFFYTKWTHLGMWLRDWGKKSNFLLFGPWFWWVFGFLPHAECVLNKKFLPTPKLKVSGGCFWGCIYIYWALRKCQFSVLWINIWISHWCITRRQLPKTRLWYNMWERICSCWSLPLSFCRVQKTTKNKLKLGPKIYVLLCTLYVSKNVHLRLYLRCFKNILNSA